MVKDYFRRKTCRLCQSKELQSVLKFCSTPPANAFVKNEDLTINQETYPLELFFCCNCKHVQLLDVVNPSILFKNYVYVSGTSPVFIKHFEEYAKSIIDNFKPSMDEVVIDIGSNDGTLLSFFKKEGYQVLGVDPAKEISEIANENGIKTINEFFSLELSNTLKRNFPKASIITANNVFAHCDDLVGILNGVKNLLSENGIFVFEVSYLVDVIQKTLFDTIYHEHLSYHSVIPLIDFFKSNGMELFKVDIIKTHGGSIRGFAKLNNSKIKIDNSIKTLVQLERELGIDNSETFIQFHEKITLIKNRLLEILYKLKSEGKKIGAFGAPAKATTLMYHFGLNKDIIDFIIDDSPLKQGLNSPGLHIPVLSSDILKVEKPDYLLLLAWNFADSIVEKNREFLESGGHFIVPLPQIQII